MTFSQKAPPLMMLLAYLAFSSPAHGQDTVTGAFEGTVTDSLTGNPVEGAHVEIISLQTGISIPKRTDSRGRFYQGLLTPGLYRIRITMPNYQAKETIQRLNISRTGEVVPVPVSLDPASAAPTPAPPPGTQPPAGAGADTEVRASINTSDARRSGSFTEDEVTALPLGATTLVRTFDELALLLPGVAPPPQTLGSVAGPGVGPGVGSAGQFAANGLRSRANNFTVDGSDNNDEDIGVRRQGFVALIPQPIESVKEYQVISLLAPAQFGRNLGAQVNAVSRSGGSEAHGSVYGFFNSSQLNARNFFDTAEGNAVIPLVAGNGQPVLLDGRQVRIRNRSGGEDSFTLGKAGAVLGGPVKRDRTFYFLSAEGQLINATREESFAVPRVEERGAFGTGATGIFQNPFTGAPTSTWPSSPNAGLFFSLFPFPNNPQGIYGANTFTSALPAGARSLVLSGKLDHNFKIGGRQQTLTGRYNFTDDWRDIPATGGAVFSTLRPRVRAQNFSFFFNSQVTAPEAVNQIFNQLRLSYGRTRLRFDEVRDRQCEDERDLQCQVPTGFADAPFLLNARYIVNATLPAARGEANRGPVQLATITDRAGRPLTIEEGGPLGQVNIAGLSPVGVDVYNFPQRRVNNTYQAADVLTWRVGDHSLAFGADIRRTELNSDLPRVARPLATFNGGPRLVFDPATGQFSPPAPNDPNPVISALNLAALEAASGFFLTVNNERDDAHINLRFYQLNFFAQDDWRLRPDLSFSFGLRYESNTPAREVRGLIEESFADPALDLIRCPDPTQPCGFRPFIAGRTRIYDPDRNNLAPRVSLAYSPAPLGRDRVSVFRVGYGLFFDQILGAVVSQSRNVYPAYLTLNFGGLNATNREVPLTYLNPARTSVIDPFPVVAPGTVNTLNPLTPLNQQLIDALAQRFPSALGLTLPTRRLDTPLAHHLTIAYEQQLDRNLVISAAYVGTFGRDLLRFTTPNLGPGATVVPTLIREVPITNQIVIPNAFGRVRPPSRPVSGVGAVNLFEATADSQYNSLQLQARGRFGQALQYQAAYSLSSVTDEVSDVFDLAGAFVLPQNSLTFAGERGPANFDARHRVTYNFVLDLAAFAGQGRSFNWLLNGLQLAGTGRLQTGQPFTVNSTLDVNLDGNLTDRLNSTDGLEETGDPRQPLRLTTSNLLGLLAPFGQDGRIGRNTFRAGGPVELDLAVIKQFALTGGQRLSLRADFFNFINRANFGVPVRLLEASGFGKAANTTTPGLRVQFALRYVF